MYNKNEVRGWMASELEVMRGGEGWCTHIYKKK